jgi:hypothetical protein
MATGFAVTGIVGYSYYASGRWKKAAAKIQGSMDKPIEMIVDI